MSKPFYFPFLFLISTFSLAQDITTTLQKSCVKEQLSDHNGLRNHTLHAQDFKDYCKCESDFINQNTSDQQKKELLNKSKEKPQWLGEIKTNAFKSCMDTGSKTTT